MKKLLGIIVLFHFSLCIHAQMGQITGEAQLRLSPVWVRVADVNGEKGSVESAEFSRDGTRIVTGTKFDNSVIMWRTSDGAELWRAYASEEIERVAFSPDDSIVAGVSEDYLITLYNANTGKEIRRIELETAADGLAFANTKNILVSGQEKIKQKDDTKIGYIRAYDMETGELMYKVNHGETVNEIQFTADDTYFLSAGMNSEVKIWETDTGKLIRTLTPGREFGFVCGFFSPDGKYVVASGFKGDIFLWDFATGELLREWNTSGRKVETLAFTADGRYLLSAGNDPYIRVYRTSQILNPVGKVPIAYAVHANDQAEYIDFNTDSSFLTSAHQDGTVRLWTWMSEDQGVNAIMHKAVKKTQSDAKKKQK